MRLFIIFYLSIWIVILDCLSYTNIKKIGDEEISEEKVKTIYINFEKKDLIKFETIYQYNETVSDLENERYYVFDFLELSDKNKNDSQIILENKQKDTPSKFKMEIHVYNNQHKLFKNIKDVDFENYFQKICSCNFTKRGWTLLDKENVREYHYYFDKFYVISKHLNWQGYLIRIEIFSSNPEILLTENTKIVSNMKLIN